MVRSAHLQKYMLYFYLSLAFPFSWFLYYGVIFRIQGALFYIEKREIFLLSSEIYRDWIDVGVAYRWRDVLKFLKWKFQRIAKYSPHVWRMSCLRRKDGQGAKFCEANYMIQMFTITWLNQSSQFVLFSLNYFFRFFIEIETLLHLSRWMQVMSTLFQCTRWSPLIF